MSLTCLANPLGNAPLGVGDTVSTVMPINYVSTGYPGQTGGGTASTAAVDWSDFIHDYNNQAGTMSWTPATPSYPRISRSGVVNLSFDWRGNKNGFTVSTIKIYIRKVLENGEPAGTGWFESPELNNGLGLTAEGTTAYTFNGLPPGTYEAQIRFKGSNGPLTQFQFWRANSPLRFYIPNTNELRNMVSCTRPILSPRSGFANGTDTGDRGALVGNIAQPTPVVAYNAARGGGLDHGLAAFPGLADLLNGLNLSSSAAVGTTLTSLASNPSFAFECFNTNASVKLDYSTRRTDGPNCMRVDTAHDWSAELTQGLLTGGTLPTGTVAGRLKCPTSGQCNYKSSQPVMSNPGGIAGSYNNDRFSDFILKDANGNPRYLSDPFFMSLDTYLHPSVPLVTPPNDTINSAVYKSPRFFWVPVESTAYVTTGTGRAADYPILTFRPIFLTSDSSSQITTPVDMLLRNLVLQSTTSLSQTLTDFGNPCPTLLGLLNPLLGILGLNSTQLLSCESELLKTAFGTSQYLADLTSFAGPNTTTAGGLVIDTAAQKVRAARIMSIAPGALPAVPSDYAGPTSDYLGVGPKIVRLTK
jgi:hypothetical protein